MSILKGLRYKINPEPITGFRVNPVPNGDAQRKALRDNYLFTPLETFGSNGAGLPCTSHEPCTVLVQGETVICYNSFKYIVLQHPESLRDDMM